MGNILKAAAVALGKGLVLVGKGIAKATKWIGKKAIVVAKKIGVIARKTGRKVNNKVAEAVEKERAIQSQAKVPNVQLTADKVVIDSRKADTSDTKKMDLFS